MLDNPAIVLPDNFSVTESTVEVETESICRYPSESDGLLTDSLIRGRDVTA